jgi:hypothetical protein
LFAEIRLKKSAEILFAEIWRKKNVEKFCRRKFGWKKSAEILFAEIRLKKIGGNFYARKFG